MGKYSKKFKLEVVRYCLEEKHGYIDAAKHFNIPGKSNVQMWCREYKKHGEKGLEKNPKKYDGKFKQNVIEYMHDNQLSAFETAIRFRLSGVNIVNNWERIYYEEGPLALYKDRRGRRKMKSKKNKLSKEVEEDLVAEVQRLRMENAYLKKLQALVQERTKPKNGKK